MLPLASRFPSLSKIVYGLPCLRFRMALAFERPWLLTTPTRTPVPWTNNWAWAVVSYGPISQVFPFLYPLADRYLYFILPGLIGGVLLAAREGFGRVTLPDFAARRELPWPRIGVAVGLIGLAVFAERSTQRARIWRSAATVVEKGMPTPAAGVADCKLGSMAIS